MNHQMNPRMTVDPKMQECINNCTNCHAVCIETDIYCLQQGGRHVEPRHMRLMMDCAQICAASADFMLRGSDFHARTCGVCAEVCEACAVSCEQFSGDAMMQRCAEACRACAQSCREMATMAH